MKTICIILAAGLGKRMNSTVSKVLHKVCGVPMLQSVISTARQLKSDKIIVIAGKHIDIIKKQVNAKDVLFVMQKEAKGTGHALLCAMPLLRNFRGVILVINGDTPLVTSDTLKKFLSLHKKDKNAVSILSFIAKQPVNYGRVIRNNSGLVLSITEDKDADPVQKKINEVNSGVYAINPEGLHILNYIKMNKSSGEYYLTDIVELSAKRGLKSSAYCMGTEEEFMGVNTKEELYRASTLMKMNILKKLINKGVNFLDTGSVFIHPDVLIGKDTAIFPNVYLEGHTRIGRGSTIYPNVRISNSIIGSEVIVKDSTVIENSVIRDKALIGPFAHIRPGSEIGSGARIGNFVELKKTSIGNGTKALHLSYLGDTKIGRDVNIGAGTITCNYDGEKKHKTIIADDVFVGSDSQLIAPVKIGKGAYIGAGSTITKNVPPGALALSRVQQKNLRHWARKKSGLRKGKGK